MERIDSLQSVNPAYQLNWGTHNLLASTSIARLRLALPTPIARRRPSARTSKHDTQRKSVLCQQQTSWNSLVDLSGACQGAKSLAVLCRAAFRLYEERSFGQMKNRSGGSGRPQGSNTPPDHFLKIPFMQWTISMFSTVYADVTSFLTHRREAK